MLNNTLLRCTTDILLELYEKLRANNALTWLNVLCECFRCMKQYLKWRFAIETHIMLSCLCVRTAEFVSIGCLSLFPEYSDSLSILNNCQHTKWHLTLFTTLGKEFRHCHNYKIFTHQSFWFIEYATLKLPWCILIDSIASSISSQSDGNKSISEYRMTIILSKTVARARGREWATIELLLFWTAVDFDSSNFRFEWHLK